MSSPSGPHLELERRYRRLLKLFPAHYRRAWEEELVAVLLQAASPGQRQVQPAEAVALLWQAVKPGRTQLSRPTATPTIRAPRS